MTGLRMHIVVGLACVLGLTFPATPAQSETLEQHKGNAYIMGVDMGYASYFGAVLSCCKQNDPTELLRNTATSLQNAGTEIAVINAASGLGDAFLPRAQIDALKNSYNELASRVNSCNGVCELLGALGLSVGSPGNGGGNVSDLYTQVVALRDTITPKLNGTSLNQAYVLGVNIGIAEGQASAGGKSDAVRSALMSASQAAQNLQLNTAAIRTCLAMLGGGIGVLQSSPPAETDVYRCIVSARATLQSSL